MTDARMKVLTANRKCERAWVEACRAAGTEDEDRAFDRYHEAKAELHEALDAMERASTGHRKAG